jgi:diphthine synthase
VKPELGELVFVGLGLHSERSMSLQGVEEAKTAEKVFAEFYTSLMPELSFLNLERLVGKRITLVSRKDLEDDCGKKVLEAAEKGKAVLLVPGDPLIATTHVDLRIRAKKQGINTRVVHGTSVISAVMGLSGLQNYKFGRSVTVPFTDGGVVADTAYNVIEENKKRGLHSLCFLDLKMEEKRYMTVKEGLKTLLNVEQQKQKGVVTSNTMAVGVARAGSNQPAVKADIVKELQKHDFGSPPHSLIFLGKLHFMEAEALIVLAEAPESVKELVE